VISALSDVMAPGYDPSFKMRVLDYYQQFGPKEAAQHFEVKQSVIQKWRRDARLSRFGSKKKEGNSKPLKRRHYDLTFKESVLEYFRLNGESETCSKYQINANLIYKWRQKQSTGQLGASNPFLGENKDKKSPAEIEGDVIIRRFKKYPDEKKKEVVQFFCQHGKEATLEKYKISNPKRLQNWRKKFHSEIGEFKKNSKRKISSEEAAFREEVIRHSNAHGVPAAAKRLSVSSPKIWDWRTKAKRAGSELTEEVRENVPAGEKTKSTNTETAVLEHSEDVGIDCDPFVPDNFKLEAGDTKDIDIQYNSISLTDLMHVDAQLLSKKEVLTEGAGIVRIKDETILDVKIEVDEDLPVPGNSSEI